MRNHDRTEKQRRRDLTVHMRHADMGCKVDRFHAERGARLAAKRETMRRFLEEYLGELAA